MILTKSVSRFARNTVDALNNIRELKARNIGVFFERENIWTLDAKGEFLITLLTSLAQEESRSISENTTYQVGVYQRATLPYEWRTHITGPYKILLFPFV